MTLSVNDASRTNSGADIHTFLIADVRSYTSFTLAHGDEKAAALAARFASIARECVGARDGEVIELRGDEALAVFSSTRQALRAATELQERFARESDADPALPLHVGIGIDAGEAIPLEGGFRGAALNLAARLCSLAGPGEILASDTVRSLARKIDGLEYSDRGAANLKGFADPVGVVAVSSRLRSGQGGSPSEGGPTLSAEPMANDQGLTTNDQPLPIGGFLGSLPANPMVARDAELRQALAAVDAVAGGYGRTVLLAGEPGAGKTRLAQEVTLALRDRGFLVGAGRCYEAESSIPYYPFLEAIATVFRQAPEPVQRDAPRRWPYLGALLPDLIGVPEVAGGAPDEQQRVFRAVSAFLEALTAERPVAILLDDLHWADSGSLKLLLHLARTTRGARILLQGAYRDVEVGRQHPLEDALRELSREDLMERVAVRRLDQPGTAALMASVMGEEQITEEFARLVYERTEGNPFFVQQVMRVLVERGDIYREEGAWRRKQIAELSVPESVRAVIGQRLSHFSEDAQEILREAAVLGQTFTFAELLVMSDRPEGEIERTLDEAERSGLVRAVDRDSYGFDHALTQGTLYAELSTRRRRRLHLAAAKAIETVPERKRKGREAELAGHLLEADVPERALPYAFLAGDAAAAVYAHAETVSLYRVALELAREIESDRVAEALEKLGRALVLSGGYGEADALLEEAIRLAHAAGDVDGEARAVTWLGWMHSLRYTFTQGVERLRHFLDAVEQTGHVSPDLARAWIALANLYLNQPEPDNEAALDAAGRAEMQAGNDLRLVAAAGMRRGLALSQLSRFGEARQVTARAVEIADASGELDALMRSLNVLAHAESGEGNRERFRAYHERAFAIAERVGDADRLMWYGRNLYGESISSGHWRRAREDAERTAEVLRKLGAAGLSGEALVQLAHLSFLEGMPDEAVRVLDEADSLAGDTHARVVLELERAFLNVLDGRPHEAIALLDAVLASPQLGKYDLALAISHLAESCADAGDLDRAESLAAQAVALSQYMGIGKWNTSARRARGHVAAARGEWEAAATDLEAALSSYRGSQALDGEAQLLFDYGTMLARKGDIEMARERFQESLAIWRDFGAGFWIERVERALAELQASYLGSRSTYG